MNNDVIAVFCKAHLQNLNFNNADEKKKKMTGNKKYNWVSIDVGLQDTNFEISK